MRKIILSFLVIVTMLFYSTCSNESFMSQIDHEDEVEQMRTLTLEVFMPEPTTRVALEQKDDKSIGLTWEEGDQLQLAFVQGITKIKSTTTVKNISNDKKKAEFKIDLPADIKTGKFNLYGIYGGGGLSDDNPTEVVLPTNAGTASSLTDVQERKDVMFYFASKDIDFTNPLISVTFNHLGSLFSITLKNTSNASLDNLSEARLVGVNGDSNWAYNSGIGGEIFNLESEKFQETTSSGNYISLKAATSSLGSGEVITFWGWYPPLPDKKWPELKLELRDATKVLTTSIDSKPAKSSPTAAGRSYYFHAEWDGSQLEFITQLFDYKTKRYGGKTWMIENLNYSGEDGDLGKIYNNDIEKEELYGRYYTWHEAMTGIPNCTPEQNPYKQGATGVDDMGNPYTFDGSSSSFNIQVQGVCPEGWHIPNVYDWYDLVVAVKDEYNVPGSSLQDVAQDMEGYIIAWDRDNGFTAGLNLTNWGFVGPYFKGSSPQSEGGLWSGGRVFSYGGNHTFPNSSNYPTYMTESTNVGFNILPGGRWNSSNNKFEQEGLYSYHWSAATSVTNNNPLRITIGSLNANLANYGDNPLHMMNVRCVANY